MISIESLKAENEALKKEIARLRNRGQGRKKKFNSYQESNIKNARKRGDSYKKIATTYGCSISLIYKILNKK